MTTPLADLFKKTKSENRAALIAYIPAGYPTQEGCKAVIDAFADAGVDAIEIGFPYSDPVMDGPTIQEAANTSLNAGTGAKEVFDALAHATSRGIPSVVMTYWNPIEKYFQLMKHNHGKTHVQPRTSIQYLLLPQVRQINV
jgi:tryptophan synthase alpha chain